MNKLLLLIITLSILFCALGCSLFGTPQVVEAVSGFSLPALPKVSNWIVTMSILTSALSVVAMFNGSKSAISGVIGGVVALGLAITIQRYAGVIAFAGLIGAFGFLVWTIFIKRDVITQFECSTIDARQQVKKLKTYEKIDARDFDRLHDTLVVSGGRSAVPK